MSMSERKDVEISVDVISTERRGDLVIVLAKRPDFAAAEKAVRPVSIFEMTDMGKMVEQLQQTMVRTQMPPMFDNSVMKLVLTMEEYNKIGSPYIGSKIKFKIAMNEVDYAGA